MPKFQFTMRLPNCSSTMLRLSLMERLSLLVGGSLVVQVEGEDGGKGLSLSFKKNKWIKCW